MGWGGKGDENVQGSGIGNMLAAWGGQCNTGMVWGRQIIVHCQQRNSPSVPGNRVNWFIFI